MSGSKICYWAMCALSGSVGYYCAMWAVFSSIIFTECELCLTVSFVTVQRVLFGQGHLLLCSMGYVMQCQFLLNVISVWLSFVMCCFWQCHLLLYSVGYFRQCDLLLCNVGFFRQYRFCYGAMWAVSGGVIYCGAK